MAGERNLSDQPIRARAYYIETDNTASSPSHEYALGDIEVVRYCEGVVSHYDHTTQKSWRQYSDLAFKSRS